jgi:hypothetical protein
MNQKALRSQRYSPTFSHLFAVSYSVLFLSTQKIRRGRLPPITFTPPALTFVKYFSRLAHRLKPALNTPM